MPWARRRPNSRTGSSWAARQTRAAFVATLSETCNVTEACRAAGIGRSAAYQWRQDEASFAAAWDDALEAAADMLEQVAFERAKAGHSDRMLEILLKAHRPKYRGKQIVESTVSLTVDSTQARQEIADLFGPTPHLITEQKHGE